MSVPIIIKRHVCDISFEDMAYVRLEDHDSGIDSTLIRVRYCSPSVCIGVFRCSFMSLDLILGVVSTNSHTKSEFERKLNSPNHHVYIDLVSQRHYLRREFSD